MDWTVIAVTTAFVGGCFKFYLIYKDGTKVSVDRDTAMKVKEELDSSNDN